VRALAAGAVAAFLAHEAATAVLLPPEMRLPALDLIALDGSTVQLAVRDRPLVLNLWATWCPPCRREMPMLTDMAATLSEVDFVFANQGETEGQIRTFLLREGLPADGMIRDPNQRLMAELAAIGLPGTLVFDAEGRLVAAQTGEVSRAVLGRMIAKAKDD
jgi:thiol-disulfide isomerase/thioredoxin